MRLLGCLVKDVRLLLRDRAGLAVLFVMPLGLVLVVTLVQQDAFEAMEESVSRVLVVDRDRGVISGDLLAAMTGSGSFALTTSIDGQPVGGERARALVLAGAYQACVFIPEGLSSNTLLAAEHSARQLMFPATTEMDTGPATTGEIAVCFDPAIRGVHRRAILAGLESLARAVALERTLAVLATAAGRDGGGSGMPRPVGIREIPSGGDAVLPLPTSVQQNVPAWTLFAMFFVVIPLSATLIQERDMGTLARLRTLPVSYGTIVSAKVIVYVLVCLAQFGFMLFVGAVILPRLGTPALEVGTNYAAMAAAAISAALAATGFGILLGTVARTHDQAAMLGATLTVIASALGGIMVPVSLMPAALRTVSQFSPLNWGQSAFLEIFLCNGSLVSIAPYVLRLLTFFVVTTTLSVLFSLRQEHL